MKVANNIDDIEPSITPKTEEEKDSKNSTASIEQNIVYNLMNKSHSRSNSNKRSSDQNSKLSGLSDLRNNSLNEGKAPNTKAKTEKSLSDRTVTEKKHYNMSPLLNIPTNPTIRKDSEDSSKTFNIIDVNRKFSALNSNTPNNQRSKSFTKVP